MQDSNDPVGSGSSARPPSTRKSLSAAAQRRTGALGFSPRKKADFFLERQVLLITCMPSSRPATKEAESTSIGQGEVVTPHQRCGTFRIGSKFCHKPCQ